MQGIGYKLKRAQDTWPLFYKILMILAIVIDILAMVAFSQSLMMLQELESEPLKQGEVREIDD